MGKKTFLNIIVDFFHTKWLTFVQVNYKKIKKLTLKK